MPGRVLHPVVGDRGDRDEHVAPGHGLLHRLEHLLRGAHVDARYAGGGGQRHRPADQRHRRARFLRGARHRVAHLSRARVGDDPHRVDRLLGRAGGHDDALTRELSWPKKKLLHVGEDVGRLGHAAHAHLAARLPARRRADDVHAVGAQGVRVALRSGVLPHLHVHGRRHHQRAAARDAQRGKQVVGEPLRQLGHEVRGSGRDQDELAVARQLDMPHAVVDARIPQVGPDALPGQRLQGRRAHESRRRLGHDHAHLGAGLREQAHQLRGLVRRDAAGDADDDVQRHARLPATRRWGGGAACPR